MPMRYCESGVPPSSLRELRVNQFLRTPKGKPYAATKFKERAR
jgi:hypothetical protein